MQAFGLRVASTYHSSRHRGACFSAVAVCRCYGSAASRPVGLRDTASKHDAATPSRGTCREFVQTYSFIFSPILDPQTKASNGPNGVNGSLGC